MEKSKTWVFIGCALPLEDLALQEKILPQVTEERQNKVRRMRTKKGKALSLGAEILLKKALFQKYQLREALLLETENYGKPRFQNHKAIHFNLSHSGDYVACALSEKKVGIDIQKKSDFDENIVKRFFSEAENHWWINLPKDQKKEGFYDLWTGKESYMKYTGQGFNLELKDFTMEFIKGEKIKNAIVFEREKKKTVCLKKYEFKEDYALWCCGEDFEEEIIEIDLGEMEEGFERKK